MSANSLRPRLLPVTLAALLLTVLLAGVAVLPVPLPEARGASATVADEIDAQFAGLSHDLRNRAHFLRVAGETYRPEALILPSDRDPTDVVLRRTAALLADLQHRAGPERLSALAPLAAELERLRAEAGRIAPGEAAARRQLFREACAVRRKIAFLNPLLDFDRILFIKRHRAIFEHMCDQFYGAAARPGGGLFVLEGAFGPQPRARDLLASSPVTRGRLAGRVLSPALPRPGAVYDGEGRRRGPDPDGGSFLSPELSFDGRTILFAHVEGAGDGEHRFHTDPAQGHWHPGRCYHIFKVNADGSGLEQLTDGSWNDFDPCFLPSGRITFISERRGGYLRCGRVCPLYTLYSMAPDGSDLAALSINESNEWQPSVANDGRILYTRWDYVDRHGCTAHMPWTTTPDGRDARAVHGNFSARGARPDMELDCRAIPGSTRFVATAAPHHGQAFGSLVLVSPEAPDDDPMGPIRRLTPEVGFPESQGGREAYGTAWPLSEDYCLCAYDAGRAAGTPIGPGRPDCYGLYLVDAWGNRELIYRDPEIACLSPIPFRPRPMPPVLPDRVEPFRTAPGTGTAADPGGKPALGTVTVANVYDGTRPLPAGTRIAALRVLQALPMSVPSGRPPHDTGARLAGAGDSVVPVRHVLGTVPVEADGSAHFTAPAHRKLFFQALDEQGRAVQSMRSATYLQQGEHLACQGCHEPRHKAPPASSRPVLALGRPPSAIAPDVDGTAPFSYPRLVQPVLDRHCVSCHSGKTGAPGQALNLTRDPIRRGWYASYQSLLPYAFTDYGNSLITEPGRFGARASALGRLLEKGHHGVTLSAEEKHRLTVWLDCSSLFYGVYEKEGGAAQLRGEVARPSLE